MENFTRAKFDQQHIDEAAVALAHRGLFVTIRPGPPGPHVVVRISDGVRIMIRQDPTVASLYVVELSADGPGPLLDGRMGDNLPLLAMVELIMKKIAKGAK